MVRHSFRSVEALPDALLGQIAKRASVRSFPRHAVIVMEGDDTDTLYVLLAGRVRAYVSQPTAASWR